MAGSHRDRWRKARHEAFKVHPSLIGIEADADFRAVANARGSAVAAIAPALKRLRYKNWSFSIGGDDRTLVIFGATSADPGTLARFGPYAIAEGADDGAIIAVAVAAVVAIEGEEARAKITIGGA